MAYTEHTSVPDAKYGFITISPVDRTEKVSIAVHAIATIELYSYQGKPGARISLIKDKSYVVHEVPAQLFTLIGKAQQIAS